MKLSWSFNYFSHVIKKCGCRPLELCTKDWEQAILQLTQNWAATRSVRDQEVLQPRSQGSQRNGWTARGVLEGGGQRNEKLKMITNSNRVRTKVHEAECDSTIRKPSTSPLLSLACP